MAVGENKDTETATKFVRFVFFSGVFQHKNTENVKGK